MRSLSPDSLSAIGTLAVATSLAIAVHGLLGNPDHPLRTLLRRHVARRAAQLAFLRAGISARGLLISQAAGTLACVGLGLLARHLAPIALVPLVWLAPEPVLSRMRDARLDRLEQQLHVWLTMLANALRATPSLGEGLASSARLAHAPLREELEVVLNAYRLGTPLDEALAETSRRVGSRTFTIALLILRVGRNAGGDMPTTLEHAATTLRELARLEGVLRAKTAEARSQAVVIGVMPLVLVAVLSWLNPDLLRPLPETATGHVVMAAAAVLWITAMLSARRILAVDM